MSDVSMPLVPAPIREVLSLNPGITAKRCAELMNRKPCTVAARLGRLADYGVIERAKAATSAGHHQFLYRLKDDAHG